METQIGSGKRAAALLLTLFTVVSLAACAPKKNLIRMWIHPQLGDERNFVRIRGVRDGISKA